MKIREVAKQAGVSHQAIYKRLKARGISAESITDKATGELTGEGVALMMELYPQIGGAQPQAAAAQPPAAPDVVETLRDEVQRLRNQLSNAEERNRLLTDERDYLRKLLDHSQEMEGLRARLEVVEAGQRAAQAQALTDGSSSGEKQRRGLWARLRGKGRGEA